MAHSDSESHVESPRLVNFENMAGERDIFGENDSKQTEESEEKNDTGV